VPGAGLAEPVSETLLGGGVGGKAARKGRSMLRLFWRRSVVWEGEGGGEDGGEGWRDVGCGFGRSTIWS